MNIGVPYLYKGIEDVTEIQRLVLNLREEEWSKHTFRQRTYGTHKDTQAILLKFCPDDEAVCKQVTCYPLFNAVWGTIKHFVPREARRILLARLPSGKEIPRHQDSGYHLLNSHRHHVPILTNKEVLFFVGKLKFHMGVGEVFEINNALFHRVVNGGSTSRIHLIYDVPPAKEAYGTN